MAEFDRVRVVCWNVHAWRGTDGLEEPERIGGALLDLAPDIVGLQEVANRYDDVGGGHQLELLAKQTGLTPVNGPTMIRPHGDYGNALLTRLPVREVRHIDLSFPNREPRAALDVDLGEEDRSVRVIVTHLGLRPVERRFQVRSLIRAIEERACTMLVLMGDLNEWFIFGRPARWLHRHFGHRGGPPTFPSRFPLFALDRIFTSPPDLLQSLAAVRSSPAREASDHLPLLAKLRMDFSASSPLHGRE